MESNFRIFRPLNHQICINLFSRDYIYACTKLSELHTKAPEHSFAYTKKTIEPAFGGKLPEIFEDKPVASGSIAQVHRSRATLRFRYPGQHVKPHSSCHKVAHLSKGSCPFASTCASCYFGGNL
ncbi:hypothetical protein L3X38_016576 [Prunus dulcis]|uniref:ABC1 atypical kinase-like domain-containing protein n=1 Tax=Prunus dulcis TaxID=3755 RepID=A0AAD4W5I6_PRUDU|nr:hypothetical protein L3X38_016576 [Prunus dulcis]